MDEYNNQYAQNGMHQNTEHNSADDVVDEIAEALDNGKRDNAMVLSDELWSKGGQLSPDYEQFYIECLLDMGKTEYADILLAPVLQNLSAYARDYCDVLIKYGVLSGKMNMVASLGEYPGVRELMGPFYDWFNKHKQDYTLRNYEYIIKVSLDAVRKNLCAFDILFLDNNIVEFIFYSTLSDEENESIASTIDNRISNYYAEREMSIPEDWLLIFDNIANRVSPGSGN